MSRRSYRFTRPPNVARGREAWVIVAVLVALTVAHGVTEMLLDSGALHEGYYEGLHHAPVALYMVPVAYGGFAYGLRGGLITGVASMLLTIPNMLAWHRDSYSWMGEALFMLIVVLIGAGLALPATRERRQRRAAEMEADRLTLLNKVASGLDSATDLTTSARRTLEQIVSGLDLEGAGLALWIRASTDPILVMCSPQRSPVHDLLEGAVLRQIRRAVGVEPTVLPGAVVGVALSGTTLSGALALLPRVRGRVSDSNFKQLVAAVANQIGLGLENVVLHRQEEERLRSFVDLATRLQEAERARIAREIHDESAQSMALLCRGLRDVAKRAQPELIDGPLGLRELTRLSQATLESVRGLARDARPATLDDLGLVPSLEWLAGDFERRSDITTTLNVEGPPLRIDPEAEVAMFRIVQEALRNVERHARASSVGIRVSYLAQVFRIEIADDGVGFTLPGELSELIREEKLGLVGMRERARLAGGSLEIRSRAGSGTTVTFEVRRAVASTE